MAVLENKIQEQQAQIEELNRKLVLINEVFTNAQRARFAQSNEKASYVMSENQICLFNEAEKEQNHKVEESTADTFTVKAHARKKKHTLEEMTPKRRFCWSYRKTCGSSVVWWHLQGNWQEVCAP